MPSWSRRAVLLSSVGCLLAACSSGQAGNVAYYAGVDGEGNHVMINLVANSWVANDQDPNLDESIYLATVQSVRGIGQASIAWWGKPLPHPLWFQLQLNGLEQFSLIWEGVVSLVGVNVSVNSRDRSVNQSYQLRREDEVEITPDSPYWMDMALPTQKQKSYLLKAPAAFFADAPRLWAITWIDFYR